MSKNKKIFMWFGGLAVWLLFVYATAHYRKEKLEEAFLNTGDASVEIFNYIIPIISAVALAFVVTGAVSYLYWKFFKDSQSKKSTYGKFFWPAFAILLLMAVTGKVGDFLLCWDLLNPPPVCDEFILEDPLR